MKQPKISPGVQPRPQDVEQALKNITACFLRYAEKERQKRQSNNKK